MSKTKLYWICQLVGWFLYVLLNMFFYGLQHSLTNKDLITYFSWYPSGVLITHLFRYVVVKLNWLKFKTYIQIPLVVVASVISGTIFHFIQYIIDGLLNVRFAQVDLIDSVKTTIDLSFVFFFWSLIYFSFHFLSNYTRAEIQSLKWQATIKEIELNKLKSQLNPHFMFNAMNSIRALIDEDPIKAKEAITQLSNILRNTLMMEKNKVISFEEEIRIVTDYLNLEKIRFEERLHYSLNIVPGAATFSIPPLLLQTLVENGIKHGISKLTQGGEITIDTSMVKNNLLISIKNSGTYNENKESETGFGLKNTRDRLSYVYGDKASIEIFNGEHESVVTNIMIPKYSSEKYD